ncbi:MAG: thiamine phosphate synthase, partial [Wenzhouxiangella sp.]|nr:thiamine phosphate synthase [Wenzhouxiangella sp.]
STPLLTLTHHYDDRSVRLMLREVDSWDGCPIGLEGQQLRWVSLEQAEDLPMPAADRPIIKVMGLAPTLTAIPDPTMFASEDSFLATLASVLRTGARFVRLNMQSLGDQQACDLAGRCAELMQNFEVRWLLESTPEIASRLGADGVFVSAHRLQDVRSSPLPDHFLMAVQCSTRDDLVAAGRAGADFAVLESKDSETADTSRSDWSKCSALIADSPVPVFITTSSARAHLAEVRALGAYGLCTRVLSK